MQNISILAPKFPKIDNQQQNQDQSFSVQEILQILSQDSLKETEQINLIKQFCNQILKTDKKNLRIYNNDALLDYIIKNIGECKTDLQYSLLALIDTLAQRGSKKQTNNDYNFFYRPMLNSGILKKIETLLNNYIHIQKEDISDTQSKSQLKFQLMSIYFLLMKERIIEKGLKQDCLEDIIRNVQSLIEKLKSFNQEKEKKEKAIIIDAQIETEMKSISKVLNTLKEIDLYQQQLAKNKNLHEIFAQLIHLNCNSDIQCDQSIVFPLSDSLQDLQAAIFQSLQLKSLERNEKMLLNLFVNKHKIGAHFKSILCQFINNITSSTFNCINNVLLMDSSSSIVNSPSHNVVISILQFIYHLRVRYSYSGQKFLDYLEFIPILVKLTSSNRQNHEVDSLKKKSAKIRRKSLICLQVILSRSDPLQQQMLFYNGFGISLSDGIAVAGGSNEWSLKLIDYTLTQIEHVYKILRGQYGHVPQPEIIKQFEEQFEGSGGYEEFSSCEYQYYGMGKSIQNSVFRVKEKILNIFNYLMPWDF